ncbi:glycoside hydrolase family 19 protein [Pseudomonas citronellolis]|uniref:glycoside hydrolase family 19 protein n=1 Tax=Pseudomonas citronellolis TaxID=53408 RepID=UPI00389A582F
MPLTQQQLLQILPSAGQRAGVFVPALNRAMIRFGITSNVRMAAFLAQTGHESAQLTRLVESLNYGAQGLANTWPSRYAENPKAAVKVPNALAVKIARNPPLIANTTYAGRNGNGPASSGDGWLYRGRGLIMVTGRANYRAAGAGIGQPLEDQPELLEQADFAAMSAAWWWSANGLNDLADAGRFDDITRRINGGLNGQADRLALWEKAKAVLV